MEPTLPPTPPLAPPAPPQAPSLVPPAPPQAPSQFVGVPTKFCIACRRVLDVRAETCPYCGAHQGYSAGPGKDRLVAALLALLLGGFGIHKFYLGKTAQGVIYLVFFWTGIPGLIAWIETIAYLLKSDRDWAAEYGGPVQHPNSVGIGCVWLGAIAPLLLVAAIVALIFLGGQVSTILSNVGTEIPVPTATHGAQRPTAAPSGSGAAVDRSKIEILLDKLKADPSDTAILLALGDEYYAMEQYTQAGAYYDQLLAIDPKSVQGLLARGAVYFNVNDLAGAERTWKLVVTIEPDNQEVHYDLGFLYLNQPTPNWKGVQAEWYKVIEIDPTSELAKTVQSHLDDMVGASMIPATPKP
jgi:TM2 domain-containing membrane protein YozV